MDTDYCRAVWQVQNIAVHYIQCNINSGICIVINDTSIQVEYILCQKYICLGVTNFAKLFENTVMCFVLSCARNIFNVMEERVI